jgi:[acyl-carrier-protein] S-malonyltransferase
MLKGVLFSGQGAQRIGMGKSLAEGSEQARDLYQRADDILGWKLSEVSWEGPEELLTETRVCQPALYVMGYAVFKELERMGRLDGLSLAAGLSLGELTALAAAGAFSFEDGLRVVAERGRLMQLACDATDGTMASVIGGEREDVAELCAAHDVDMANVNCPGQIVISGARGNVEAAMVAAKASGRYKMVVPLKVAGAYHSRLMESARVAFGAFLKDVPVARPQLTVLSNTTGKAVREPDEIREALTRQVVSSVLWEDCMREAQRLGVSEFAECGVGGVLTGMAKRIDRSLKVVAVAEYADLEKVWPQ